jgi:hypothetical protein
MAPGVTQPLTEMSIRNISWGKGGRCVGLTTLPLSYADCLEIWEPQPPGILKGCPDPGLLYIYDDLMGHTFFNDSSFCVLMKFIACSLLKPSTLLFNWYIPQEWDGTFMYQPRDR